MPARPAARPAAADQTGQAEDLAGADVQRDVLDRRRTREPVYGEHDGSVLRDDGLLGKDQLHRPPEHGRHEALRALLGRRRSPHDLAVTKHGDGVDEREHLFEQVRDVDDRRTALAQAADDLEEPRRLVGRERRGRLVHHDEACIPRDRTQDLDLLLVGHAERAGVCIRRQLDAGSLDEIGVAAAQRASLDHAGRAALETQEDVLEHRAVRNEGWLLGDDRQPVAKRVARRAVRDLSAVDPQLAVIRTVNTGHDLPERRLPRAVLADEAVDRAALDLEVDGPERMHAPEALVDPLEDDVQVPLCGCDAQASAPTDSASRGCGIAAAPPLKTPVTAPGSRKTERSPGSSSRTMASKT
jgi:hypothetical protein